MRGKYWKYGFAAVFVCAAVLVPRQAARAEGNGFVQWRPGSKTNKVEVSVCLRDYEDQKRVTGDMTGLKVTLLLAGETTPSEE